MSQEHLELIERSIAAINAPSAEDYLACCTQDIELHTPWAPIEGVYEGKGAIRRFFDDVSTATAGFQLILEGVQELDAQRSLALLQLVAIGRASGIGAVTQTANIYDFRDGLISRIRVFADRGEARQAAGAADREEPER
jgi:ketosteroid isomerase-like protein